MAALPKTQHLLLSALLFLGAVLYSRAQDQLYCPEVPPDQVGSCAELCQTGDLAACGAGELCCPNGCGLQCTIGVSTPPARILPNSGIFAIDDVYVILIGMGCVIVVLFVLIIITLCCYATRKSNNNDALKY